MSSPDDYTNIPIDEWILTIKAGSINNFDGAGKWMKDNKFITDKIFDNVFSEPPEGTTSVAWYSK